MKIEFKVIGITGSIASGKSTVANFLEKDGKTVIRTDELAKKIMQDDEKCKSKIIDAFGSESFKDGKLNREFLAEKVFSGTKEAEDNLSILNGIVHPFVIDEKIRMLEKYMRKGQKIVYVESALIFEAGLDEGFDYIITVFAPEKTVLERAKKRGMSENQFQHRLKNQMHPEEKKKRADFVINNEGSIAELEKSVRFIADVIEEMPPKNFGDLNFDK